MQSGEKIAMAKKMRNFAAVLAISAVVGTMLLILVFLLPVGPMRRNVEKSVGDMLKTGDEIPEDAFSKYLWKNRETYTDAIMVQNAIERPPDKNAYEHAMWMYHYDLEAHHRGCAGKVRGLPCRLRHVAHGALPQSHVGERGRGLDRGVEDAEQAHTVGRQP